MSKSKSKLIRYSRLLEKTDNWGSYLLRKAIGFKQSFDFKIKNFGTIEVDKAMMGPFRENFFDEIYFRHIPTKVFEQQTQPLIIDIGANVGFFSLTAFSKFPKSEVYSFEPHPYCFKVMSNYKQTFEKYAWNIFQRAVTGGQETEIRLSTSTASGFATMTSVFDSAQRQEEFVAQTVNLDSFIKDNISHIDFMKVDCEGAEYSIIYNLSEDAFNKINSICIETHRGQEEKQNTDSLNDYLRQKGLSTIKYDESDDNGYIWAWKKVYNND